MNAEHDTVTRLLAGTVIVPFGTPPSVYTVHLGGGHPELRPVPVPAGEQHRLSSEILRSLAAQAGPAPAGPPPGLHGAAVRFGVQGRRRADGRWTDLRLKVGHAVLLDGTTCTVLGEDGETSLDSRITLPGDSTLRLFNGPSADVPQALSCFLDSLAGPSREQKGTGRGDP